VSGYLLDTNAWIAFMKGQPIGPYDAQIAAIARAAGICAVTRNVSEFGRVPALRVENWQSS